MKLAFGIPLFVVLSAATAACYVSPSGPPAPAGTGAGHAEPPASGADPSAVKSSELVAHLVEQGIPTDVTFDKALATAKADDKKTKKTGKDTKVSQLMSAFTKGLGVDCEGCHVKKGSKIDFEAKTENMAIAMNMWNKWVVGFKLAEDGSQLFCDSCHNGQATFLPREEGHLGEWMKANYKGKFVTQDDSPVGCKTCHGEKIGPFLESWKTAEEE